MSLKVTLIFVCSAFVFASVQGATTGRIVGGEAAQVSQFPYQVSVRMVGQHVCGGSIISDKFILTAAHCVAKNGAPIPTEYFSFSIRAGSNDRLEGGVVVRVKSIIIHENYLTDNSASTDIAVLELERQLTYSSKIQPIELASEEIPSGSDVIISGWGLERDGSKTIPIKLQYNTLKAISKFNCLAKIGMFSNAVLCLAHEAGNGACSGDSGGPAAFNGKLVGVAGFVVPSCGTANPDGYAKVSFHYKWIKSLIA